MHANHALGIKGKQLRDSDERVCVCSAIEKLQNSIKPYVLGIAFFFFNDVYLYLTIGELIFKLSAIFFFVCINTSLEMMRLTLTIIWQHVLPLEEFWQC